MMTNETLSSSLIEGELLKRESVRDSLQKRLDIHHQNIDDSSTKHTDNLAELLLDSYFNHDDLTIERLHNWNKHILQYQPQRFEKLRPGIFRDYDDMSVVSGAIGKEKIEYLAPPSKDIEKHINKLIDYTNNSNEHPYIKASTAHLYFVAIHPYDDGNGRIARTLSNYILAKEPGEHNRYFALSMAIQNDKKSYYAALTKSTNLFHNREFDFSHWHNYMITKIDHSLHQSKDEIKQVEFRANFWDFAREQNLNERQKKVLSKLLEYENFEGGLSAKKYQAMTKASKATATRDLSNLQKRGLIVQIAGTQGKSTKYEINRDIDNKNTTLSIEAYRVKLKKLKSAQKE